MKSAFLEQLDNLKNKLNVEMGIQTENNDNEIKAKQEELAKLNLNLKDKIESYEKMKEEMEEFQKRTLMHSKEKEKFMMTLSLKRSEEEKIMEDRQNEINMKNEIIQSQLEILNIAFTLLPSTKKGTFKDNLIKHNNLMISNNYESMKNPESNQAIELNNNKNSFIHEILKESNEIRKQLKSKIDASQSLEKIQIQLREIEEKNIKINEQEKKLEEVRDLIRIRGKITRKRFRYTRKKN